MVGRRNNTKNSIIELTIKSIDELGYSNISLRKLARQLELTTGAFYKHFATKNDLWSAVTQKLSNEIATRSTKELNSQASPETKLLTLSYLYLKEFEDHPNLMDFLFFNPTSQNTVENSTVKFPYLNLINDLIDELITTNNLQKDKQTLFLQLWSFIQGYGFLIKNGGTKFDQQLVKNTLNDFLKE